MTAWLAQPVKLLIAIASRLPRWALLTLGAVLGALWFAVLPIRRRVVIENLRRALPELSFLERWAVAAGTFRHVATTVLELFWFMRLEREELERLVSVEGLEHYQQARAERRGVIAVTAHLGSWDVLACSQALAGVPLSVVTKSLSAKGLSRLWMEARERSGLKLLPAKGSALALVRSLRRGEVVGLVVDQRTPPEEGGALVPFFGAPAWTTLAPHQLALRTGAVILPVWSYRAPSGRHHVVVGERLELGASAEETMERINAIVESWIRRVPHQYLWLHRRWSGVPAERAKRQE